MIEGEFQKHYYLSTNIITIEDDNLITYMIKGQSQSRFQILRLYYYNGEMVFYFFVSAS